MKKYYLQIQSEINENNSNYSPPIEMIDGLHFLCDKRSSLNPNDYDSIADFLEDEDSINELLNETNIEHEIFSNEHLHESFSRSFIATIKLSSKYLGLDWFRYNNFYELFDDIELKNIVTNYETIHTLLNSEIAFQYIMKNDIFKDIMNSEEMINFIINYSSLRKKFFMTKEVIKILEEYEEVFKKLLFYDDLMFKIFENEEYASILMDMPIVEKFVDNPYYLKHLLASPYVLTLFWNNKEKTELFWKNCINAETADKKLKEFPLEIKGQGLQGYNNHSGNSEVRLEGRQPYEVHGFEGTSLIITKNSNNNDYEFASCVEIEIDLTNIGIIEWDSKYNNSSSIEEVIGIYTKRQGRDQAHIVSYNEVNSYDWVKITKPIGNFDGLSRVALGHHSGDDEDEGEEVWFTNFKLYKKGV